jgi:hypothetical protein
VFDSEDMAEAYSNGFHAATETLQITVTTVCPMCLESLLVTKHPLPSLPLIIHTASDGASSARRKYR